MTTSEALPASASARPGRRRRRLSSSRRSPWFHVVMVPFTLLWVSPIVYVLVLSLRSDDDVLERGLGAIPQQISFEGFRTALGEGMLGTALRNSLIVTSFTVTLSLFLASLAAFALSRHRLPLRRTILLTMLAGNLLPPQVLLVPVSRITASLGIYDTLLALVVVQVGFGLGFYTFVLHGFMRSLPAEVFEAARIDGAGEARIYGQIVLPLCRPALAALAALATTWVFNDLIWAMTVLRTQTKFPVTAALLNLQGGFVSQWNVVGAGAVVAALPTAAVFFAFQRQFVSGLLVGTNK